MSGRIGLLSTALALQLVIIAAVLLAGSGSGDRPAGPFVDFDAAKVSEIRITGGDDHDSTLVLSHSDDGWRLPDGQPADGDKVSDVLGKLAGLPASWPVATSAGAAKRFEVTSDDFQRHVVLVAGKDVVADLYLGTSPGYQQVHARRADDDAVYSVAVSNYQVPVGVDDWLDKTLLQPKGKVTAVERQGGWRLSHGDEGWLLGDVAAGQKAAEDLVRRLTELRVTGEAAAPSDGGKPAEVLAVTDAAGTFQLSIYKNKDGNSYRIGSDRREGWFGLAGYTADKLLPDEQALLPSADESKPNQSRPVATDAVRAPAHVAPHPEPG